MIYTRLKLLLSFLVCYTFSKHVNVNVHVRAMKTTGTRPKMLWTNA